MAVFLRVCKKSYCMGEMLRASPWCNSKSFQEFLMNGCNSESVQEVHRMGVFLRMYKKLC
jgi:hypothetical protein